MENDYTAISSLIPIINRGMRTYFDDRLAQYHIGWGQHALLEYIYENPGVKPQDLTNTYHIEKCATSRVLKVLYKEEYIRIETDALDRRSKRLYPTAKADDAVRQINELHYELEQIFMQNLSPLQLSQLEAMLVQLYHNLADAAKETIPDEK